MAGVTGGGSVGGPGAGASESLGPGSGPPRRLGRDELDLGPVELARRLLRARLVVVDEDGTRCGGRIVETEAYLGGEDLASHSRHERRTPRNAAMFGPPAHAYVYLVYGMHHCFNVSAAPDGRGTAVLVRAIAADEGLERMRARRPRCRRDRELGAGPGRLCAALGITRADDGLDLATSPRIRLEDAADARTGRIRRGPRIGVHYAGDWADRPLRFWIDGHPSVSAVSPGRGSAAAAGGRSRGRTAGAREGPPSRD